MEAVRMMNDTLLSLVRNVFAPVLSNHVDPVVVFTFLAGGAILVSAWIVVLMIVAAIRQSTTTDSSP